ncbi:MAG: hypothetical protein KDA84_16465 [Planctomycetaceae bacterium]|nr:hypothetical protein [Planctomycetaceae bacterium]
MTKNKAAKRRQREAESATTPSGLWVIGASPFCGLTPAATCCHRFAILTSPRMVYNKP